MTWDLWVDFLRTDGDGLTHASLRNARAGLSVEPGQHIVVGNEDADLAVARVVSVGADGVVLVAVLPGPAGDHLDLLRPESTPA
jgi:hypothetical protein